MGILANENAIQTGGYNIANSLRFQSASSTYLARTPASAGNRKTWTLSMWVKRGQLGTNQNIISTNGSSDTTNLSLRFDTDDKLWVGVYNTGNVLATTQVFRDPSAWYHIVWLFDTTQATVANRCRLFINGSEITAFSTDARGTYFAQNGDYGINTTQAHAIGRNNFAGTQYIDGYMTEVNFVDGQALTPSSFGETNTLTGQWVAKKYTGTYGTNGFYLPFSNGTSTTTLGADSSGNGNNWTLNNFTRSAGVSDCWMIDVPSGNGGASATQPSSNYCVLNPLWKASDVTINNGNLREIQGGSYRTSSATIYVSSGKWYFEMVGAGEIGAVRQGAFDKDTRFGFGANQSGGYAYNYYDGQKANNGSGSAYGASYTGSDTVACALDLDNGTITFYKNNVSQGVAFSSLPAGLYTFACGHANATVDVNFGQRSFTYTPPSGFKALCTANLPASTIVKGNQYMDATLYNGNSSTQNVVNAAGFQPDIVWMKARSINYNNLLHDSSRGVTRLLIPNGTDADQSVTDGITSFNSNGFSLGANGSYNQSTRTYVGWQWKVNGGTTVSNTSGSITSTVQVNPTAGVSVVTYTGTGTNATVGHGLGVAPKMMIVKNRDQTGDWCVYHVNMNATPQNYYMQLNLTNAAGANSTIWNNTAPTSTTFSIGSYLYGNAIKYVAYCFAEIAGFSKFGSYTGNASADGNFLYFGFRPKYIMIKNITTNGFGGWVILDSSRNPSNVTNKGLAAESAGAEFTVAYGDFLSNGFKIRIVDNGVNASGQSYIYMAFAENPFAQANAR